jgi:hypothetical protein
MLFEPQVQRFAERSTASMHRGWTRSRRPSRAFRGRAEGNTFEAFAG